MHPACRRRQPRLGSAWQFPPVAARPHPPGQSRRFLKCRRGNRLNTPAVNRQRSAMGAASLGTGGVGGDVFEFVCVSATTYGDINVDDISVFKLPTGDTGT